MAKKMGFFGWLTYILLVVGGLNWGLVGWFDFNLVTFLSFGINWIVTLIYTLVGLAGAYGIILIPKLVK